MKMLDVLKMPPPHCTRPSNLSKLNCATFTPLFQHNPTTACLLMQQLWGLSYETGQFRYFTKILKELSWDNCLLKTAQHTACYGAMISAFRSYVHAKLRGCHVIDGGTDSVSEFESCTYPHSWRAVYKFKFHCLKLSLWKQRNSKKQFVKKIFYCKHSWLRTSLYGIQYG